ncbi:MAG: DUF1450 domain-containing protein [Bacilli bacterium]
MRPLIEFCVNNASLSAKEQLEQDLDLDVIDYSCLGNCGICYTYPYCMVDGEIVEAETEDELVKKVYEMIERNKEQLQF